MGQETAWVDCAWEIITQSTLVVLTEGLPPISTKLLEKIQRWEFIDLSSLLSGEPSASKSETVTLSHEGQQILVVGPQSQLQPSRHKKQIVDFATRSRLWTSPHGLRPSQFMLQGWWQ